ncbi:hypothetical protein AMATHDRAFT_77803 [Amanita thiersii Skay4041]|uniref:Lysine-specific metallo-endopeptidase domain-containing protein n=1 Tax=Amanita thiersii Skay4041 TaxID=703135 RepID=A0A2A9N766_9AGAR|nr:hypothetical protein AMATHDRAFT_77803 [Amanita thiersii Skay4041]
MFPTTLLKTTLFAIVLSATTVSVFAVPSLSMEVTGPDDVQRVEAMIVTTTITNTGDKVLQLLNEPNGPLSDIPTDTFEIKDASGNSPEFIGIRVKYALKKAIESGDMVTLAPRESTSITHDLSKAYNFTRTGQGKYSIRARSMFYVVDKQGEKRPRVLRADTKALSAQLSGSLVAIDETHLQKPASFNGCTLQQQLTIQTATRLAFGLAKNSELYLQAVYRGTPRYTTWFGTYSQQRHDTVLGHYSSISGNNFRTFNYDCTCDMENVYAYVYPDRFGQMYFCPAFWRSAAIGTDSQAGTIIHEASHYIVNGGTNDFAYGQDSAKELARTNPDRAVFNADSHEYFAENTPLLL